MEEQQRKIETIDQYIGGFPQEIQIMMQQVRQAILDVAPQAKESLSWEMPTFKIKTTIVQFAGHKKHLGVYPYPEAIEHFKNELSDYKTTKGGIQFPYNKPIPLDLIRRMVAYNVGKVHT